MKTIDDLSNSEKEELICKRYKRESNREILRERFIDGLSHEEICSQHYRDWMRTPERVKRRIKLFLSHKFVEFCKYVERRVNKDEKVLVEVSEDILNNINEPINDDALLRYIIKKGVVFDELTNGEVIQKMFPNMKVDTETYKAQGLVTTTLDESTDFLLDWWNRKWGE